MRSRGCCRRRRIWVRAGSPRRSRRWRGQCCPGHRTRCPVVVGGGELRIGPDRRVKIGDGALAISLEEIRGRPVAIRLGELGIEPDRLVKVGDGGISDALVAVHVAPVVVGGCELGTSRIASLKSAMARSFFPCSWYNLPRL